MNKLFTLLAAIVLMAVSSVSFAQVTVSGALVGNGSYTTLKLAFDAINAGAQTSSNIVISITGNTTETASAQLNAGAWTTLSIQPSGGAARTISGAIAAGSPLINLNGADNVTINGLNTGGNSLNIQNTTVSSTAGTSTLRLIGDATNNLITNCTILGSSTTTIGTAGGNIIFSTGTTTGNDNNTISNNNIGPVGSNLPSKCIFSLGSTTSSAIRNSGNNISNNNIFDFFINSTSLSGIYISSGNDSWTISNNRLYQTSTRTFSSSQCRYAGITINSAASTVGSYTVSGNTIGFANSAGTGNTIIAGSSNEFRGIDVINVSTTIATSIQDNVISGINQTSSRGSTSWASSAFIAISMGTTNGLINATGNTIGSLDGSSTIVLNLTSTLTDTAPIIAIFNYSFYSTNILNNNIGYITIQSSGTVYGFRGILVNTATGVNAVINNNTITNITDTQVGAYAMYGIQCGLPNLTATGNIIRNFTGSSTASGIIAISGILATGSTGVNTISQNTIHSLSNNSGSANNSIYTLYYELPNTSNIVERNLIHSISLTGTNDSCQIIGILNAFGSAVCKNNMIRLGVTSLGASITNGYEIMGIWDYGSTTNYYNNSVYLGGSNVASSHNTYCFLTTLPVGTRNIQNNIFHNARSNGTGTIANLSIGLGTSTSGLTCNYNLLRADGVSGTTGIFNAVIYSTIYDWRTATGQDSKSFTNNPAFINATGDASSVNLHIQTDSLGVNGRGTYVAAVTNDYDNDSRPTSQSTSVSPVDVGADQYTPSSPVGNLTSISGLFLVDGDLAAIELVDGDINISKVRQFPGVQTPNNGLRPGNHNSISTNKQKVIKTEQPVQTSQRNIVQHTKDKTSMEMNVRTVELSNKTYNAPEVNQTVPAERNNMHNHLNAALGNKINNGSINRALNNLNKNKGTSEGQIDVSAVTSPWIYWTIDGYENNLPSNVILRFYYNVEQLATIPEANLKLSYWDGTTWDNTFTQTVNTTSHYIEVTIPGFISGPANMLFAMEENGFPLPVELTGFNVAANNRDANLTWSTSHEVNNKGFAVERRNRLSVEGNSYSQWKEVAFINGSGTTNEPKTYTYSDKKLNTGTYQYRLKQVDFNSNFEYFSPSQSDIAIGNPGKFDIGQNYPNPSNPKSKIDYQIPFAGKVSIKVYDIIGQEVATIVNELKETGYYSAEFDGSSLASGIYFYRIIAEGNGEKFTKTLKMVLVK